MTQTATIHQTDMPTSGLDRPPPADLDHTAGADLFAAVRQATAWLDAHNGTNPQEIQLRHVGSTVSAGGALVWHCFERVGTAADR